MKKVTIKENYDCIIAGAGPAGCSAAYFISQAGLNVLLVDKAKFPRDKTCGDGVAPSSLYILDQMGIMDKIKAIKPWIINRMAASSPDCTIAKGDLYVKGLPDTGYTIPRMKLDEIIFNHTKNLPGITAVENFRVTDLVYDGENACGITGRFGRKNYTVRGRYIIAADGVNSIIARKLDLLNRTDRHRAFSVRAYFDNVSDLKDEIELHFDERLLPGYGWIFPVGGKKANVGVITFNHYTSTRDIRKHFDMFIKTHKIAKEKLKKAKMIKGTYKGWMLPLGSFPRRREKNNVLLIGDAGSLIDIITGEGMFYALASGKYAGMAVKESLERGNATAGEIYQKLVNRNFKYKKYIPSYILQKLLTNKNILNAIIHWAGRKPKRGYYLLKIILHATPV